MTGYREVRIPCSAPGVQAGRAAIRTTASAIGASSELQDTAVLVVDELMNNAIEHGCHYRGSADELTIRLSHGTAGLVVEFFDHLMPGGAVRDLAAAMHRAGDGLPSLDSERGRGLFLISAFLTEVRIAEAEAGGLHLWGLISGE